MYRLQVKSHFDSAHYLRGYEGKCANEHGHRWEFEVVVESKDINDMGMVMDFTYIKAQMDGVKNLLDHKMINDIKPFTEINPTAENLAKFIFDSLDPHLTCEIDPEIYRLARVCVWESPESCVKYYREK